MPAVPLGPRCADSGTCSLWVDMYCLSTSRPHTCICICGSRTCSISTPIGKVAVTQQSNGSHTCTHRGPTYMHWRSDTSCRPSSLGPCELHAVLADMNERMSIKHYKGATRIPHPQPGGTYSTCNDLALAPSLMLSNCPTSSLDYRRNGLGHVNSTIQARLQKQDYNAGYAWKQLCRYTTVCKNQGKITAV